MRWWDVATVEPMERELFASDAWSAAGFWSELAGWPATRHYVVAEDGAGVVGYAGLLAPRRSDADVQTVAVAPDARGRGIGALLLDDLLAAARTRECPAVLLEVRADNAPALALYARRDFERIGVRRGYYDAGRVDALVLRKRLARG
jgi:ribosomal-protein-alanine N-acetyltransferase